ncbi:lysylphosphatidylglycerol synthase transmembrane domain-containing protein [Eisenbergiella sp.]
MKTLKKYWKWLLVLALISVVCLANRRSLPEILREVGRTPPMIIGAACLLSAGYFLAEGAVIRYMAKRCQPGFTLREGVSCALYCAFYRVATLGSGSGVAEIYYLNTRGIEAGTAAGMSLVQYILHKTAVAVYGIAGFIILCSQGDAVVRSYRLQMVLGCILTVLITAVLIMAAAGKKITARFFRLLDKKLKPGSKAEQKAHTFQKQAELCQHEGGILLHDKKELFIVCLLDAVKLSCWYVIPWLLFAGTASLSLTDTMLLTALIQTLAAVIPCPSGIGAVEYVFSLFFGTYVSGVSAVSASLVYRFATFLFPCIPGAVLAWRHFRWNKKRRLERIHNKSTGSQQ